MDPAVIVGELLGPLLLAGEDRAHLRQLLDHLGQATDVDDELFARYQDLARVGDLREIAALVVALADPSDPREPGEIIAALVPLAASALEAVGALAELGSSDLAGLVAPFDDPATWNELALLLPEYLLGRFLTDDHPVLAASLALLGLVRRVAPPEGAPYEVLDLDAVGRLLADPTGYVPAVYGWGGDFDYPTLVDRVAQLAVATGRRVARRPSAGGLDELELVVVDGVTPPAGHAQLVLRVLPLFDGGGQAEGMAITAGLLGALDSTPVAEGWSVTGDGALDGQGLDLRPGAVTPHGGGAPVLSLTGTPAAPWVLLGAAGGVRLELTGAALSAEIAPSDVRLTAQLGATPSSGLRLVLAAAETDGFLAALLATDVTVDVGLSVTCSSADGLSFGGAATFETTIPIYRSIGVVELATLTVTAGVDAASVTAVLSARLGPVTASVDGLGVRMLLTPAADGSTGTLGPYDIAFAFQPPHGVGLAIDAGVAGGGGYLYLDHEAGKYAGVLDVDVLSIGISAFGLIDTKAIDGEWSMFFALFLDLPSIPLAFGFTLEGVGGLAGINRTLDTAALDSAIRCGGLDAVLFPPDPIADAPMVIAELSAIFPPSDGRYVFGPVVKIGWGVPTLITAELGVVISLPDPVLIVVLGSVTAVLPTEYLELVALRLDVAGVIDAAAGTLAIDASLHDSHVIGFALAGDMALRATFKGPPSFLLSVGGFHPGFEPVEPFPELARLSLSLTAPPVLYISLECYFALTSNSVQFGSAFELRASVAGFGISGSAEFDAVVQFSPFLVSTRLGFHVAVTAASVGLAGVWLEVTVDGPNPWYVVGNARFRLLGFEEEVRIDERIGAPVPEAEVEEGDPLALIRTALASEDAWSAPATLSPGVVPAAGLGAGEELVAMPDGLVVVSQRVVPLGVPIDKLGDAPLGDHDLFEVEPAEGSLASTGGVQDWFAPGYFFELASTEQLSAPSFELQDAGIEFGGGQPQAGPALVGTLDFEQILRDPELDEDGVPLGTLPLAGGALTAGATVRTPAGFRVAREAEPVALAPAGWAVTHRNTGLVVERAATWSTAHQSEAGRRTATAVVPDWEVPA